MHKAIRSQADDLQLTYSQLSAVDTTEWEDLARQEFKVEADINEMLKRFGVLGVQQRPLVFGDVDYSIDLQQALFAVKEAKRVWERMPADVKAEFPTWQSLLNAANTGDLKLHFEDPPKPPVPEGTPAP